MIASSPEVLDRCTHIEHQTVYHDMICRMGDHKIRVRVKRNVYDFQSSVTAEHWGIGGWNEMFRHPIHVYPPLANVNHKSTTAAEAIDAMAAVEKTVLELAEQFLEYRE